MEVTVRLYDINKPELNCFGSNNVHPLFVWSQAHIHYNVLEELVEYKNSSFHHIALLQDREPRLYEWCIDSDNELKFVYEINRKTGLAREKNGNSFILDGCLRVVTGTDPKLREYVYTDQTHPTQDNSKIIFSGLPLINIEDRYLLVAMFNKHKLFLNIIVEAKYSTGFKGFVSIPVLQIYNTRNKVVSATIKAISKDVRASKVVRDGLVKPKTKMYTARDMEIAYNTGFSDHSRGLENNEGLNRILGNV